MTTPAVEDLDAAQVADLFARYQDSGARDLRNRLVETHLRLADYHVGRFSRSSGVASDDLRQTAYLGILKAVERFDPDKGVSFRTFASRTVEGELKRYLRDRAWAVRPPRRSQELHLHVRRVTDELSQRIGRSPTVAELADEVGASPEQVLEAMEAGQARSATALDAPGPSGTADSSLARLLGAVDSGYQDLDQRLALVDALDGLDERQRSVLQLRYIDEMSQPEIAAQIGVSQSYVSRILRTTLSLLREQLDAE